MTTTADPYTEREARAAQHGWTWVSDHSCPRKLTGKRCLINNHDRICWCAASHQLPLNDHGATWKLSDGQRFVLWEPYHAHSEDLHRLAEFAHADGLRFDICQSVWNPPYTIGIRFHRADEQRPAPRD